MPAPYEKLAESLAGLKKLQAKGRRVFRSREFSRVDRERLLKNGFLQSVMKGWLISASPGTREGDSTPWYASFWEFCARYCEQRFGEAWHLAPEQSLLLQSGDTSIPRQVVIYSPKAANNTLDLPFDTSLFDLRQKSMPPGETVILQDGLRLYSPAAALIKVTESFYQQHPVEAQIILSGFTDASEPLRFLLAGGHSAVAGRIAGAFRSIGKGGIADEIVSAMKAADYSVQERDPFDSDQQLPAIAPATPPVVARLQALWDCSRGVVLDNLPDAPGLPKDRARYLKAVDDIYTTDAYHSLSIEGYRVTPELIERVRSGAWNPDEHEADKESRGALAARGYWQAFQAVKRDVAEVLSGTEPGGLVRRTHREWYRELFQPCVAAGIIRAEALAGYRNDAVFLRNSRHVPPRWQSVSDATGALFTLMEEETEPAAGAVLGHWLFGYLHPYSDGNGRMARFLMNVMLASGGYPWTVIRVEDRTAYLAALEAASIENDIKPFAKFIAKRIRYSAKKFAVSE